MSSEELMSIAMLLRERNRIDARIADIVGRPVASGHLSDWIAAQIFDIELEPAANSVIDGRFRGGALAGRTVNIKHYTRNQGLLDMTDSEALDYYLVMTGPAGSAGAHRPWSIEHVYLFDAQALYDELSAQLRRIGVATSVRAEYWRAAEVYPNPARPALALGPKQTAALASFKAHDDY